MNTTEFLNLILPQQGNKILAIQRTSREGRPYFKYTEYPTADAAAEAASAMDARGETVYHAVNAFGDWYTDPVKNKKRIRTQENVVACRALFDDYDVSDDKPNTFRSKEEALAALITFAKAVRLVPTVVASGGGLHVYIPLIHDVTPQVWRELSELKRDITTHLGILRDTAVDLDVSRLLRPVGVHNRKYDTPTPVTLVKLGPTYSADAVRSAFTAYIQANNVPPAPRSVAPKASMANPFAAAGATHAPSDAEKVADLCPAVKAVRDSGGNVPEPHWHRFVGAIKACENGPEKIHAWSSGYTGYTHAETQAKIDEWTVGPTSCEEMDRVLGCAATCPVAGKCKYPIQLGVSATAPSVSTPTPTPAQAQALVTGAVIEGEIIPYWPSSGYRWNGAVLSRAVTDPDGVTVWRPFSRSFLYPINRVRDADGVWIVRWRAKEKSGRWREFDMPTLELASQDLMSKTLAANEIFLVSTKTARIDMAEFGAGLVETLQQYRIETHTCSQFGWTTDRSGFIIGTSMITATGEERVECDKGVPEDVAVHFGTAGTLEEWVANIATLCNRPGAEPFQLAICHSMGSVLVELFGSTNWHGLPLAFTGTSGSGKSTAAKIACGFYGNPKLMERQAGEQGSTIAAIVKRVAVMGPVPFVLDEFSGRSAEELTRMGYALANGRDKERLGRQGGFSTVGGEWFKNSFVTSNDSIVDTIGSLSAAHRAEATQLRFFEISLPDTYLSDVFPDISQGFVEDHLNNVYGSPLRPYIRFLINNYEWVRRQLVAARESMVNKYADMSKERFYMDLITTALVAGKIGQKLGLISFDVSAMRDWAVAHVKELRDARAATITTPAESIAAFVASLHGRLIITRNIGDRRSGAVTPPMEPLRGEPVGRVVLDDKRFFVTIASLRDFAVREGVPYRELKSYMERNGYTEGGVSFSVAEKSDYIGKGTTVASAVARCVYLDFNKLYPNGVPLTVVPQSGGAQAGSSAP